MLFCSLFWCPIFLKCFLVRLHVLQKVIIIYNMIYLKISVATKVVSMPMKSILKLQYSGHNQSSRHFFVLSMVEDRYDNMRG